MKMSEMVEWALHCCLALAWIGPQEPVPATRLAAKFGVPPAYLGKCLQALARAGILTSTAGAKGGFRLTRAPENISVLEVVQAVDGSEPAFRCTEIRQQGEGAAPARECRRPCAIAATMKQAEMAWRRELSSRSLADLMADAPPTAAVRTVSWHQARAA
ncbi:MAG TPA: Rrf2 family transcriptional regulator [Ramlibacter sp.]|nr:Rrf2 family transcriptional regulator [Ramlibacter sp.]